MLCDFCVQMPEIMAFYHMVGNFNVLLCFAVPDVKTLDALVSRVRTFGDSRTSIELQTVFEKVDPTNRTVVSLYSLYYNSAGAPRTASPAFALSALPLVYKRALSVLIGERQIFRLSWPQSCSSHLNTRSVYDHESI